MGVFPDASTGNRGHHKTAHADGVRGSFLFLPLVSAVSDCRRRSNPAVGDCRILSARDEIHARRVEDTTNLEGVRRVNLDGVVFQLLQNGLNAAQLRQQVYANNIANVDTPGFQRQDVVFEDLLQYLLGPDPGREGAGSPSAADWTAALRVSPQVVTDRVSVEDNNGNNVDIDAEMAKLAQNQIRYNTLVEDVRMRLDRLKTAIEG